MLTINLQLSTADVKWMIKSFCFFKNYKSADDLLINITFCLFLHFQFAVFFPPFEFISFFRIVAKNVSRAVKIAEKLVRHFIWATFPCASQNEWIWQFYARFSCSFFLLIILGKNLCFVSLETYCVKLSHFTICSEYEAP